MTPNQIELARHALGLSRRCSVSYRNYFTVGEDGESLSDWRAMADAGDAWTQGPSKPHGGDYVFWLTRQGAEKALTHGERLDPEDFPVAFPDTATNGKRG